MFFFFYGIGIINFFGWVTLFLSSLLLLFSHLSPSSLFPTSSSLLPLFSSHTFFLFSNGLFFPSSLFSLSVIISFYFLSSCPLLPSLLPSFLLFLSPSPCPYLSPSFLLIFYSSVLFHFSFHLVFLSSFVNTNK